MQNSFHTNRSAQECNRFCQHLPENAIDFLSIPTLIHFLPVLKAIVKLVQQTSQWKKGAAVGQYFSHVLILNTCKNVIKLVVPMFQTESMAEPKDIVIVALSDLISSITNDTNFCNMLSIERLFPPGFN